MTKLTTKKLKQHIAEQFLESFTEPANSVYYIVASKHTPYANGDSTTPNVYDTQTETSIEFYEDAIFGKKIASSDVMLGVRRVDWTSNTVYSMYDDQDIDLFSKNFYVAVDAGSTYYIYKILDNNNNSPSTVDPSSFSTSESACNFITTSDGYKWKLLYKMSEATFEKFATSSYMPVTTSSNVASNNVSGALDVIKITGRGSNYIATLTGTFNADDLRESIPSFTGNNVTYRLSTSALNLNDYYKDSAIVITSGTGAGQLRNIIDYTGSNRVIEINTPFTTSPDSTSTYKITPVVQISGDGSGAVAYCDVASNSSVNSYISDVEFINRGQNYTYATAVVLGYTGGVSNNATLRPIIPPIGGHGYDSPSDLGSDSVLLSTKFTQDESGFITTENDYRKIVLLKDPLFSSVSLTVDGASTSFNGTENIYQIRYTTLTGTASGSAVSNTITGTGTQFNQSVQTGDYVMLTDTTSGTEVRNLRQVVSVTNATSLTVNTSLTATMTTVSIAKVDILASAKRSGGTLPTVNLTNVEPKFVTGKPILGESSGAIANVTAIVVSEKSYNSWNTFDNRTRISKTTSSGTIPEDSLVYQEAQILSNAYYHSANSTYVFLTKEKGPINADPSQPLYFGSNTITLGTNKYIPDLVKRTGKVLYIENNAPIERSPSQSETIKLTIKF